MKKKLNRRNKLAGWLIGAVCMMMLGGCGKKQDGTTEAVTTAEPAVVATNADAGTGSADGCRWLLYYK